MPVFRHLKIVSELSTGTGRHIVCEGRNGRHRLLFRQSPGRSDDGFVVAPDDWLETRIAAIDALRCSRVDKKPNFRLVPSSYQRQRYILLLKILDHQRGNNDGSAMMREIATEIIFPRSDFGRAIEWKSSSQRRQTHRLIREARYMMNGGYRKLLAGPINNRFSN